MAATRSLAAARRTGNRRTIFAVALVGCGMLGLSFAAVPLYDLFCRVTGYGGTTQVAASGAGQILDREMVVRFDSSVNRKLPWHFTPEVVKLKVRVGETNLASYTATNQGDAPLVGTATFNVTPDKMGQYFNKIECFCFQEQLLEPGESMSMPVTFYVDPEIINDKYAKEVKTITLSYTFFKSLDDIPEIDLEKDI